MGFPMCNMLHLNALYAATPYLNLSSSILFTLSKQKLINKYTFNTYLDKLTARVLIKSSAVHQRIPL